VQMRRRSTIRADWKLKSADYRKVSFAIYQEKYLLMHLDVYIPYLLSGRRPQIRTMSK
jgi:hypothetical protein